MLSSIGGGGAVYVNTKPVGMSRKEGQLEVDAAVAGGADASSRVTGTTPATSAEGTTQVTIVGVHCIRGAP
jgi:ABC-type nitrate/sulfonate/bicarbonate transport system substrate-binding protein